MNSIPHVHRLQKFPDQLQRLNDLPNRSRLLMAICDSPMRSPLGMEDEKVRISGDQDSLLFVYKHPVSIIASTSEISFRCCADINSAPSQSLGNGDINLLVEMKADRPSHSIPSAFRPRVNLWTGASGSRDRTPPASPAVTHHDDPSNTQEQRRRPTSSVAENGKQFHQRSALIAHAKRKYPALESWCPPRMDAHRTRWREFLSSLCEELRSWRSLDSLVLVRGNAAFFSSTDSTIAICFPLDHKTGNLQKCLVGLDSI